MTRRRASVIVIGAGPAGVAAVGALVAKRKRVVWLDPRFRVGALERYKAVPANTKIDVLAPGFEAQYLPQGLPSGGAVSALARMHREAIALPANPDPAELGWTTLGACQELMQEMTSALLAEPSVSACRGHAVGLERQPDGEWVVQVAGVPGDGADSRDLRAPCVVLAPGGASSPVPPQLRISAWARGEGTLAAQPRVLHQEQALELHRLPELLGGARRVGVVGGGHSGVVLETLGLERTKLFVRSPLRLAQWDAHGGGYGAWAFRGLKGVAADYALRRSLVGLRPPNGPVAAGLELFDSRRLNESAKVSEDLDAVVFCLGFGRAPLPPLSAVERDAAAPLPLEEKVAAHPSGHRAPGGALLAESGTPIAGLYGLGLAFSDDEFSSGAAYGEVGFFPFAARAAEVADAIARDTWHRRKH